MICPQKRFCGHISILPSYSVNTNFSSSSWWAPLRLARVSSLARPVRLVCLHGPLFCKIAQYGSLHMIFLVDDPPCIFSFLYMTICPQGRLCGHIVPETPKSHVFGPRGAVAGCLGSNLERIRIALGPSRAVFRTRRPVEAREPHEPY